MQEYGGYIEFEHFRGNEYYENAVALNSGRSCMEYLIKARKIQTVYLPYFMCDSVKKVCDRFNVATVYYHTGMDLMPVCSRTFSGDEWLYVVNYYGQLTNDILRALKHKYGNIIVDNVQAFFQKPIDGIDTIYSCRKFFGVSDGAYLSTDSRLKEPLEEDFSYDKMGFLMGRFEKTAQEFYPEYIINNDRFERENLKSMSLMTQNLLRGLDYEFVKEIRTSNFSCLHDQLHEVNQLKLIVPQGAFMYPLYIENGGLLRKRLQQQKVYVPTLWPDVFDICNEKDLEYQMAQNILPLPCDHRYCEKDMKILCRLVKKEAGICKGETS